MPSRFGVVAVILFWIVTTGLVAYRDILPRLFASGPPPITIDLADEAGQFVPVRWIISRNGQKIGSLTTEMKYFDVDDTFQYVHTYREVDLELMGVRVKFPEFVERVRMTREGELQSQSLRSMITITIPRAGELKAKAELRARVVNGNLAGDAKIEIEQLGTFKQPLESVPVPGGRVLNPLQPVNRLGNVQPGVQWVVPEVNPLRDAVAATAKAAGLNVPQNSVGQLIAEVLKEPQTLMFKDQPIECWIIEYRTTEPVARTWVKCSDGKVLRQEAMLSGENIALEREN